MLSTIGKIVDQYREALTARGRYVLWMTAIVAVLGLDTRATQVFKIFAVGAAMLVVAVLFLLRRAPRVELELRLPERATAGNPLELRAKLRTEHGSSRPFFLSFPKPRKSASGLSFAPRQIWFSPPSEGASSAQVTFRASRRGRYVLRGAAVRAADPLGLIGRRAHAMPDQTLVVYPRFYSMESFHVPEGQRYQPGGIPLASHTGETVEFLGIREYQHGDPVRNIHWRSWARLGEPVVKEFQEEYFCRIALILDTFLPRRPRIPDLEGFEAAISVVASIADYYSRSEYVVDIFAAGPEIYEVSAGRSLAYLENILDVLACLEPCRELPFAAIGPALYEKLSRITSVVAVIQDWDEPRREFLRRIRSLGVETRIVLVREGSTASPWPEAGQELGEMTRIRPSQVEEALAAEP